MDEAFTSHGAEFLNQCTPEQQSNFKEASDAEIYENTCVEKAFISLYAEAVRELPSDDQSVVKMDGDIEEVTGASAEDVFIIVFHVIECWERTYPV